MFFTLRDAMLSGTFLAGPLLGPWRGFFGVAFGFVISVSFGLCGGSLLAKKRPQV